MERKGPEAHMETNPGLGFCPSPWGILTTHHWEGATWQAAALAGIIHSGAGRFLCALQILGVQNHQKSYIVQTAMYREVHSVTIGLWDRTTEKQSSER